MRLALQVLHRAGHEHRLVALVLGVKAHDAIAAALLAPEVLLLAIRVVLDDRVRRVEDRLRAAVVLVEHDRGDVVERILEQQDVAYIRPAPPVDTLVAVADDGDLLVALGQGEGDLVLGGVRVLVLVDEDVLEALLVVRQYLTVFAEQLHGLHQQIVEVHRSGLQQPGLVVGVDLGVFAGERVVGLSLGLIGRGQFVLPQADLTVHSAGREALGIEAEIADDVAGQTLGIGLVVDAERARVAEHFGVGTQDAHACRVERAHPHRFHHWADQRRHTVLHFTGGLVGERDGQD
ncbi:unannotated protein [freshwater metagenome]|uniref:Unannotated protein n=1 Tax=freshwater metagenome TaxID=449393 RepID=A0A6J7ATT7_9ZZZZ